MTLNLIGIDPGGETGWALWTEDSGFGKYGTLDGFHYGALWKLLTEVGVDVIICERFDLHKANEAAKAISLEYEGVVKAFAEISKVGLVMQQSTVKNWASDAKLHRLGLFHPHAERHAADAQRHILYYLAHNPYVSKELRTATLRRLKV